MLRSIHQMIVESDSRRLFLVWTMVHFGLSSKKRSSRKPSQSGRFPFRLICGTMTTRPRAMGSLLTRAYDFSFNGTNFWILFMAILVARIHSNPNFDMAAVEAVFCRSRLLAYVFGVARTKTSNFPRINPEFHFFS